MLIVIASDSSKQQKEIKLCKDKGYSIDMKSGPCKFCNATAEIDK
jgi:hypothetical protein